MPDYGERRKMEKIRLDSDVVAPGSRNPAEITAVARALAQCQLGQGSPMRVHKVRLHFDFNTKRIQLNMLPR